MKTISLFPVFIRFMYTVYSYAIKIYRYTNTNTPMEKGIDHRVLYIIHGAQFSSTSKESSTPLSLSEKKDEGKRKLQEKRERTAQKKTFLM